jgi:RND family efflux transporter MFP subunit
MAIAIVLAAWMFARPGTRNLDVVTASVVRGDLPVIVVERGELDSIKSIMVRCDVEGEKSKLVHIVPEGTHVVKGEEVARFDTDELQKSYAQQEVKWKAAEAKMHAAKGDLAVQKNKELSEIDKAELALTLAKIDLEKYQKREYQVELDKRQGAVGLAKKELKEAEDNLDFTRNLVKKGFLPYEQIRVQELAVASVGYKVSQGEADLGLLKEFDRKRKVTELEGKAREAERELERTKESQSAATAKAKSEFDAAVITVKLEKQALDRIQAQMEKCVIKAPQDGIVVYFKRYYDDMTRIQPGAVVFYQQPIFSLPDLEHMKVKVKIHESVIKKIAPGQTATLQVDALRNYPLNAAVKTVGTLANSEGWRQTVKEYMVEAEITDLPTSAGLKPGMTAEVKIHVRTLPDTLMVPVQAVTEYEGKPVCYVKKGRSLDRVLVDVGESNDQYIQIVGGLGEGDEVALDARSRAAAEVKAAKRQ